MTAVDMIEDVLSGLPKLCTIDECADLLRCSKRTITRMIARGELNASTSRSGSERVLVPRLALRAYLETRSA